jgi:hypothetical protein
VRGGVAEISSSKLSVTTATTPPHLILLYGIIIYMKKTALVIAGVNVLLLVWMMLGCAWEQNSIQCTNYFLGLKIYSPGFAILLLLSGFRIKKDSPTLVSESGKKFLYLIMIILGLLPIAMFGFPFRI